MRILIVTNTFPTPRKPDATPCIKDQIETIARRYGVTFELLHIDGTNRSSYLRAALKVFLLNLKPKKYELIHAFYGHSALVARLQARYPLVVTFLGSDILGSRMLGHSLDGKVGRFVVRWVTEVIVMTQQMKKVSARFDAHIIPFGVNTEVFFPQAQAKARADLGLPPNKKLILFPYNPRRTEKRFDIVQDVARMLAADNYPVQLLPVYGRSREMLRAYMNAADVMVLASDHEGSPMAVREAIVCNLPVVSVDVGDVRNVIDGVHGCYIARQNARDLAEKIKLSFSDGLRADGRKIVRSLDVEWSSKKVYEIYKKMASSHSWLAVY